MMHVQLSSKGEFSTRSGYLFIHFNFSGFFQNLVVIIACITLLASHTFAKIIEKPGNGTYLEGTSILLTCLVEEEMGTIIWEDIEGNTNIFIGKKNNTIKEQYQNFLISKRQGNYSLIIKEATKSDEGTYSCNEMDTSYIATVTIKAPPNSILNGSSTSITNATNQFSTSAGDKPADKTNLWKIFGTWTILILVACLPVAFLAWKRRRNYPNKYNRHVTTSNKGDPTTESRTCHSVARTGDMIFKETMVDHRSLMYVIPNNQTFCKDGKLLIQEDENETICTTVMTNITFKEQI